MKRRLTLSICFLSTHVALATHFPSPSSQVYAEGFGDGWGNWSWNATYTDSTSRSFKGSRSAKVVFHSAWAGFGLGAGNDNPDEAWNQSFPTAGFKHLTLALYNELFGDDLWLYAKSTSGTISSPKLRLADYSVTKSIPQGQWVWLRIPIADLRLGSAPVIEHFAVQSGKANSVVYFDEIFFNANLTCYEGVRLTTGPSIIPYYWNSRIPQQWDFGGGDFYLEVPVTSAWGGIELREQSTGRNVNGVGVISSDYGMLTVLFQKTLSNQSLYACLRYQNNGISGWVKLADYVAGGVASVAMWYRVLIPLRDFGVGPGIPLAGIIVESNIPGSFYLDDIVLLEAFKMPLPSGKSWYLITEAGGTTECNNRQGIDTIHAPDAAYYSLDFTDRTYEDAQGSYKLSDVGIAVPILAAASGVVVGSGYSAANGNYVRIDHDGDGNAATGITTWYLHLRDAPFVTIGSTVRQGQVLGIMGKTGAEAVHNHFQFTYRGQRTMDGAPQLHFMEMEGRRIEDFNVGCRPSSGFYTSTNVERD